MSQHESKYIIDQRIREVLNPAMRRRATIRWVITGLLVFFIYYMLWNYYWFRWTLILYIPYKLLKLTSLIFWKSYINAEIKLMKRKYEEQKERYTKPIIFDDVLYTPGEYVKTKPGTILEENKATINWTGKILELNSEDEMCLIELDSKSLLSLDDNYLLNAIEEGGDASQYVFSLHELEKTQRRDTDEQYEKAKAKIDIRLDELDSPDEDEQYFALAGQWEDDFCESSYMDFLTDYQKDHAGFVISTFLDYMYNYEYITSPHSWSSYNIRDICLDIVPRKVSAEIELFENYGDVLVSFFKFMEAQGHISNSARLIKTVEDIKDEIPKIAANSSNWGIAKSFLMGAQSAGIDITDKDAANRYMTSQAIDGLKYEVVEPTRKSYFDNIGRNEKISVQYKNGKQVRDIKFKKVEQDLLDGKCEIIDF